MLPVYDGIPLTEHSYTLVSGYIYPDDSLELHYTGAQYLPGRSRNTVGDYAVFNAKYGDYVHAYPNGCSVDITPAGVSKSQGIDTLLELMGWQQAEVFAIGDETNDLPMLEAYDGFTVDTARDAIKEKARAVYGGVGDMLVDNI